MNENILEVDRNLLVEEWEQQPKQFFEYAEQFADAKEELTSFRNELSVNKAETEEVVAQLDMKIRESPETFGISGKPTENSIRNAIVLQPEYKEQLKEAQKIQKEINRVSHDVDVLDGFLQALNMKKTALQDLVKLHGQNYFSTPLVPNTAEARQLITDSLEEKAMKRIQKKRKAK